MTLVDMSKGKAAKPAEPILPGWMQTWSALWTTVRLLLLRLWHRGCYHGIRLPYYLAKILIGWVLRGLWRITRDVSVWVYDRDGAVETDDYVRERSREDADSAMRRRRARLHGRWLVFGTLALIAASPILAWTHPAWLSFILGAGACAWLIKVIPGRGIEEVGYGLAAWVLTWWALPYQLVKIPQPPHWVWAVLAGVAAVGLAWYGRPVDGPLIKGDALADSGVPVKPTKEMVIDALCRIGIPGMTLQQADRVHEEIRVIQPGVSTSAHGYTIEMELPPGITSEMVVAKRGPLAGALRRDLGCVWPSGNEDKHPGYLRLFLSHRPMNSGKQPRWPLADGGAIDIFEPMPLFTDEEMRWVCITLAATPHLVVGGASGFGKSVWLRQLSCGVAKDPRVRIIVIDGKRSGDLDHMRKIAHAFHEGVEGEEIEATIAELRGLVTEYTKRSKFLSQLPADERSPKVTSALASKYKELRPIVVFYDEVQEGTEYGVKTVKADKKVRDEITALLTRLSRVGRSAGIYLVLASQKPEASVIPTSIMGNCSIRVAFKVSDQLHNDQILGTSARKNGIDATMFGSRDKGMAWLKGGDDVDAQVVRSWSEMVDVGLAVELAEKAYELRRAAGMLTGAAAGELVVPAAEDNLLEDVHAVMVENGCRNTSLAHLCEGLELLRPGIYGHLDPTSLGGLLRAAGIVPQSIHCPREGKPARAVQIDWVTDQMPEDLTDAG
jgi:S-DNA-T family DNA segregation ATPase FtsK/SpoIIIE